MQLSTDQTNGKSEFRSHVDEDYANLPPGMKGRRSKEKGRSGRQKKDRIQCPGLQDLGTRKAEPNDLGQKLEGKEGKTLPALQRLSSVLCNGLLSR